MKKIIVAYAALVILVLILAFAKFSGNFLPGLGSKKVTIGNTTFNVEVADSHEERMKGLSGRKSLKENEGMIFIFDKKGKYGFWMKDTFIPLDIIHIDDRKIVEIFKNATPQAGKKSPYPIYTPAQEANYVLEINGGLADKNNIKVGDTVKFDGIK